MFASRFRTVAVVTAAAFALTACGGASTTEQAQTDQSAKTVSIKDNYGTHEVPSPPTAPVSVVNRNFETLDKWGVELKAAPKPIIPDGISYGSNEKILDLGMHREPNLENLVAAQPDLILGGQRFLSHEDEIKKLAPEATYLNFDVREGKPIDDELKREVTALGKIFGKEKEAEALNKELDDAVKAVKDSYKTGDTVMALNVSGGNFGYIAPTKGRTVGPMFDLFGWTPALKLENTSNNHKGDEVSVEAIAQSNPDWIVILDRDAGTSARKKEGFRPAETLLKENQVLQNVEAVKQGKVIFLPADTYTNDGIHTHIEIFEALAKAFKG
ncbi:ABC transporter substrate-binding protein [Corynebacterium hindlerae]|uniref:ABC transporter substrate-binding protein n=1 Tax=Corynebacterium hindlerae TaxID=699041 RepID=A0A7G5FGY7_9CORY|nr:ABC transporter substrate-binding protein [Corynebacterium hindlerae]QMV85878.1 ABC transporter substrate-binding protein [Corynebacterium hindlerae]